VRGALVIAQDRHVVHVVRGAEERAVATDRDDGVEALRFRNDSPARHGRRSAWIEASASITSRTARGRRASAELSHGGVVLFDEAAGAGSWRSSDVDLPGRSLGDGIPTRGGARETDPFT
jgi:hypothetical protein